MNLNWGRSRMNNYKLVSDILQKPSPEQEQALQAMDLTQLISGHRAGLVASFNKLDSDEALDFADKDLSIEEHRKKKLEESYKMLMESIEYRKKLVENIDRTSALSTKGSLQFLLSVLPEDSAMYTTAKVLYDSLVAEFPEL